MSEIAAILGSNSVNCVPATLVEIMTRDEQMLPRITDLRNKNTGDEAILDIMVGQRGGMPQPIQQPVQQPIQQQMQWDAIVL